MKKIAVLYISLFLVATIFLILIILSIFNNPKQENFNQEKINIIQSPAMEEFKILGTSLTGNKVGPADIIKIYFNKPISEKNLFIQILPELKVNYKFDENLTELSIEPVEIWVYDTNYIIKIVKSTMSRNYQTLNQDYIFRFSTIKLGGI